MPAHPDYPNTSSFEDRHGKTRYRVKCQRKWVSLPGEPHSGKFDAAFQAAIMGQPRPAEIVRLQTASHPESLKAAYRLLQETGEWKELDQKSSRRYTLLIERMLSLPVEGKIVIGDGPVADLKRQHVKKILAKFSDTPHMEKIALICLRKLIMVAIEEEWITADPSYGMKRVPTTDGHKAWPADLMAAYEERWKIGTRQRTAYALGLWLGNRISDVARLAFDDYTIKRVMIDGTMREIEGFEFVQFKGRKRGKKIFLPLTPALEDALRPIWKESGPILTSERTKRGYTDVSLSVRFGEWCHNAGIPPGYSMHGLRKALGVKLAEADATTREIMEMLGHSNIAYAELYSREADRIKLAVKARDKLVQAEAARRRATLKVVEGGAS
jgi:integrase